MNNDKMIHHDFDAINSVAWGALTSVTYAIIQFDATDLLLETFMVVSKASVVGFFGGLFGYFAKALAESIFNWIKSKL
jgi:hypothetical protein